MDYRGVSSFKDHQDPYICTLCVYLPRRQKNPLKSILHDLLSGVDPTFQFINLKEMQIDGGYVKEKRCTPGRDEDITDCALLEAVELAGVDKDVLYSSERRLCTPALSVVLQLQEEGVMSSAAAQQILLNPPWVYHHKIELANARQSAITSMACQEYHAVDFGPQSPDLPLWSVGSVHHGNEHLRFQIITINHEEMVNFYKHIIGKSELFSRNNFSLFELYAQPGMDIQLSFKFLGSLVPKPLPTSFLKFRVKGLKRLRGLLFEQRTLPDGTWLAKDPDGNFLLLEEYHERNSPLPSDEDSEGDTLIYNDVTRRTSHSSSRMGSSSVDSGMDSTALASSFESLAFGLSRKNSAQSRQSIYSPSESSSRTLSRRSSHMSVFSSRASEAPSMYVIPDYI